MMRSIALFGFFSPAVAEAAINCAHCITQDGIAKDNCNPYGNVCVCGTRGEDWTSNCHAALEIATPAIVPAIAPAISCAHCITQDGVAKDNCNVGPGGNVCVCGTRGEDWTSNCTAAAPAISCAHCITQDGIAKD